MDKKSENTKKHRCNKEAKYSKDYNYKNNKDCKQGKNIQSEKNNSQNRGQGKQKVFSMKEYLAKKDEKSQENKSNLKSNCKVVKEQEKRKANNNSKNSNQFSNNKISKQIKNKEDIEENLVQQVDKCFEKDVKDEEQSKIDEKLLKASYYEVYEKYKEERAMSGINYIPKDPQILCSYINTKLRDEFSSLEECCKALNIDEKELIKNLKTIEYIYDEKQKRFV